MINMRTTNVQGMTDRELRSLLEELQEEFDRREREAKEKDWLAVREAIANFIEKWGWITVTDDNDDTIHLQKGVNMDSIGEIDMSY